MLVVRPVTKLAKRFQTPARARWPSEATVMTPNRTPDRSVISKKRRGVMRMDLTSLEQLGYFVGCWLGRC